MPADARRKLELLKLGLTLPAPSRPGAAQDLSEITTRLSSTYSTGKIEFEGDAATRAQEYQEMRMELLDEIRGYLGLEELAPADLGEAIQLVSEGVRTPAAG